jgi:predicted nuclease with RNAse H fold
VRALGVDVGVTKGLDVVVLDDGVTTPVATHRHVLLAALGELIERAGPDVVAIDAPPGWALRGRSRQTEREIRYLGIHSFGTPPARRAARNRTRYYEWMRRGFRAFRIAERRGYPRYRGGPPDRTALEVFPHASAVVLSGCLPPAGVTKRTWRTSVLAAQGVEGRGLSTTDQVDAALAALTGLLALKGRRTSLGDPNEGVITLPARTLPVRPYRRCVGVERPADQPRLPRMTPCACGDAACDRLTSREFAPGHDARRKAILWRMARAGHEATEELRRRGWELPPEMR